MGLLPGHGRKLFFKSPSQQETAKVHMAKLALLSIWLKGPLCQVQICTYNGCCVLLPPKLPRAPTTTLQACSSGHEIERIMLLLTQCCGLTPHIYSSHPPRHLPSQWDGGEKEKVEPVSWDKTIDKDNRKWIVIITNIYIYKCIWEMMHKQLCIIPQPTLS